MPDTAAQIANLLESIARDAMAQFESITPEDFSRKLTLPESNTLFAMATHLVGAGEFWVLVVVGKREIPRNRQAEFFATGQVEDLLARYERWIQGVHEVLDTFPSDRLTAQAQRPPPSQSTSTREQVDVRNALLHAVDHTA